MIPTNTRSRFFHCIHRNFAVERLALYLWAITSPGFLESFPRVRSSCKLPLSGNAQCLKSRHPFVRAAQLISSSDNNIRSAAFWADHRWNAEWLENPWRLRTLSPTSAPTLVEWPSQEQPGSGSTASHRCGKLPLLRTQMGYGPFCGLWVQRRGTDRWPYWPSMSNPSTYPWSTLPYGSAMMRQFNGCSTPAPRSSTAKQWIERTRSNDEEANFHIARHFFFESLCNNAGDSVTNRTSTASKVSFRQ